MAISFREPRLEPLGNTFVNCVGSTASVEVDGMLPAHVVQRSRSFAGYVPFALGPHTANWRRGPSPEEQDACESIEDMDYDSDHDARSWPDTGSEDADNSLHSNFLRPVLDRSMWPMEVGTACVIDRTGRIENRAALVVPRLRSESTGTGSESNSRKNSKHRDSDTSLSVGSCSEPSRPRHDVSRTFSQDAPKMNQSPKAGQVSPKGAASDSSAAPDLGTSVMIRNLPLEITQRALLEELDASGFNGLYDFAYMPCCFVTGKGKGFAFVNFVSTQTATALARSWHRSRRFGVRSDEPALNVSSAAIQGWADNVAKWNIPRMRRIRNPNLRPFVRDHGKAHQDRGSPTESSTSVLPAQSRGQPVAQSLPYPLQTLASPAGSGHLGSPLGHRGSEGELVFVPLPR
uniref:RRM domain-containing protein n=1 Tax=Noctiluca scintillans TaxID=2966 RepID=A0A7S1FBH0_NOCSC|mmetsp:Transcript_50620/g.134790  ORF Transcript_50620/g.134790 Transcript_50620/m.134790 type:complete len:403 (+) Transcript_50620:65-1273(+)